MRSKSPSSAKSSKMVGLAQSQSLPSFKTLTPKKLLPSLTRFQCSCAKKSKNFDRTLVHIEGECEEKQARAAQNRFCKNRPPRREDLAVIYKSIAELNFCTALPSSLHALSTQNELIFDMDALGWGRMENGMEKFISRGSKVSKIALMSSLVKLDEIDQLIKQMKSEQDQISNTSNTIHTAVACFYEKISQFKKDNPRPPSSIKVNDRRGNTFFLSISHYENFPLVKSIALNLTKNDVLKELVISGMNLSQKAAECLNAGLQKCHSMQKLRMNFCIPNALVLNNLMPALLSPQNLPLEELNLAANALNDQQCGHMVAKIIIKHSEARDEVFWQYGLRGELPPPNEIIGLKKFDLSLNKLGDQAAFHLSQALKTDRFLRMLDLASNLIGIDGVKQFTDRLEDNKALLNLDLRDNPGFKRKYHRKIALKLLANYTICERNQQINTQDSVIQKQNNHLKAEQKYFDQSLLAVQIPQRMMTQYSKKLETIKQSCITQENQDQKPVRKKIIIKRLKKQPKTNQSDQINNIQVVQGDSEQDQIPSYVPVEYLNEEQPIYQEQPLGLDPISEREEENIENKTKFGENSGSRPDSLDKQQEFERELYYYEDLDKQIKNSSLNQPLTQSLNYSESVDLIKYKPADQQVNLHQRESFIKLNKSPSQKLKQNSFSNSVKELNRTSGYFESQTQTTDTVTLVQKIDSQFQSLSNLIHQLKEQGSPKQKFAKTAK